MKKIAVVFLIMFAFVAVATIAMANQGAEVIVIDKVQKKFPPVTFNHAEHQKKVNGDCSVCHHKMKKGEKTPKGCSECHGKVEKAPRFKDAMHKKCKTCHKKESAAGKPAPTKCKACHVKK